MIDRADRGKFLFLGSIAVSAVLVLAYLAAGGSDYAPAKTQDPCKPREWRNPEGLQEIAQQFSLSALDGAACKLGVSRETLAQALATKTRGRSSSTATTSATPSWRGRSAPACCGRSTTPKKPTPSVPSSPCRCARRSARSRSTRRSNWSTTRARCSKAAARSSASAKRASGSSKGSCPKGLLFLERESLGLRRSSGSRCRARPGVTSSAPQSFMIVPRRGSRPPRSSSEISVLCSSQRKPSSSWEIFLPWRALRRLTAKRSRGSMLMRIFCRLKTETLQTKHFIEFNAERGALSRGSRARPRASPAAAAAAAPRAPSGGSCSGRGP